MQFTINPRAPRESRRTRRRRWHRHFALWPVELTGERGIRATGGEQLRVFAWLSTIERRWSQTHSCWLYRALDNHSQGE